jgi:hypothetical protein
MSLSVKTTALAPAQPHSRFYDIMRGKSANPTLAKLDRVCTMVRSYWSTSAGARPRQPAFSYFTMAWDSWPRDWSTSPTANPPRVRIISDNPLYKPDEDSGEEDHIIGRIRWFAREM